MNDLRPIALTHDIPSRNPTPLPEFELEMANTRKILECVPEGKFFWRPHESSMTLGELATHVADLVDFGIKALETKGINRNGRADASMAGSRQELLDRFDRSLARFRELLARATGQQMEETWTLKNKKRAVFVPRALVLRAMMMNHLIHHRGQLTVYLRLNEVPFPGVYGPSADD